MTLEPHYNWNMPSRALGKDTYVTREKLTETQATKSNPDAWPVMCTFEMLPVEDYAVTVNGALNRH